VFPAFLSVYSFLEQSDESNLSSNLEVLAAMLLDT